MPYARRTTYRKRSYYRRRSTKSTYRKKGPAVTVKKRVKIARKSTVMRNRSMITSLRNQMRGPIQHNFCELTTPVLRFTARTPLLFCMDDFTHREALPVPVNGCPVYQTDPVSGNVNQVSYWKLVDNTQLNPYLERWQGDNCAGGAYHAISNKCLLEFTSRIGLNNVRIRIQMFYMKQRRLIRTTSAASLMGMPDGLPHLTDLANFTANPNVLPKQFFTVVHDKTIMINSMPASSSGVHPTTSNKRFVPVTFAPKGGRRISQAVTFPPVQDVVPSPNLGEPTGGWYGVNNRSNIGGMCWLLLSCDIPYDPTPGAISPLECSISSYRRFRDPVGSYW